MGYDSYHAKRKAREKRNEEKCLLALQEQLRANCEETIKYEMEHAKSKLAKIVSINGKNSKYFFNLESKNTDRQKHIKALKRMASPRWNA